MICEADAMAVARPSGALPPEVFSLLASASQGDIAAQREMRNAFMSISIKPADRVADVELFATMGVLFARMAASHGDMMDVRELGDMLFIAARIYALTGHSNLAAQYEIEGLALYERIALTGADDAAIAVQKLAEELPIEVIQAVREHNARVAENACPTNSIAKH